MIRKAFSKKVMVYVMVLLVLTISVFSQIISEETTSVSRLVGDTPESLIHQLDVNDIDIKHSTIYKPTYKDSTSKMYYTPVVEELLDGNVDHCSADLKEHCSQKFEASDLLMLEEGITDISNDSISINYYSFDYWNNFRTYTPEKLNKLIPNFQENYPVAVLNSEFAGLSIPNKETFVQKLARYSVLIAPNYISSKDFSKALLCNMVNGKNIGQIFRNARNAYFKNAKYIDLPSINLMSYNIYANPLTSVNFLNADINKVKEYCDDYFYNDIGLHGMDFSVVANPPSHFNERVLVDYRLENSTPYDIINITDGNLVNKDYDLVLPIITRHFELPKSAVVKNITYSFNESNIVSLNIPSYLDEGYIDRLCYYESKNESLDFSFRYEEDRNSIDLVIDPVRVINCTNGTFEIYEDVYFKIEYDSKSPMFFDDIIYPNKLLPSQAFDVEIKPKFVNKDNLDGFIELYENDLLVFREKIDKKKQIYKASLYSSEKEGISSYSLKYVEDDEVLEENNFIITTRIFDFNVDVPKTNLNNSNVSLAIINNYHENKDIIIQSFIYFNDTRINFTENEVNLKVGHNNFTYYFDNLSQEIQTYPLQFNFIYDGRSLSKHSIIKTNHPPIIDFFSSQVVRAGKKYVLNGSIFDYENDTINISYSLPLDTNGEWQTLENDNGTYNVRINLSDNYSNNFYEFELLVNPYNRNPVSIMDDYYFGYEGDEIIINFEAIDEDNDPLTFIFNDPKFEKRNDTSYVWKTWFEDEGNYTFYYQIDDVYNLTTYNFTVEVLSNGDIIVLPFNEELSVLEGNNISFFIDATERNDNALSFVGKGISSEGLKITYTPSYGDSGCNHFGEYITLELIKKTCSKINYITFNVTNGLENKTVVVPINITKSVYSGTDDEIYFGESTFYNRNDVEILWNDITIPTDVVFIEWIKNGVSYLFSQTIEIVDELLGGDEKIDSDITNKHDITVSNKSKSNLTFNLPFNTNITSLNMNLDIEFYDLMPDFVEDVSCLNTCTLTNDTYYCEGTFTCINIYTDKNIVFNSSIINAQGVNQEERVLRFLARNIIFNHTSVRAFGLDGIYHESSSRYRNSGALVFIDALENIEVISSNINAYGGDGGTRKKKAYCTSYGGDRGNTYFNDNFNLPSNIIIKNSVINSIGGRPGHDAKNSDGDCSGDSMISFSNANNIILNDSIINAYTFDGSQGEAQTSGEKTYGAQGGCSGTSNINFYSMGDVLINNLTLDAHTGNGINGKYEEGGTSGSIYFNINSGKNVKIIDSELKLNIGNAGNGDCDERYDCENGGDTGESKFLIKAKEDVIIDNVFHNQIIGVAGSSDDDGDLNSDAGDGKDARFEIHSLLGSVRISNTDNFYVRGGKGGIGDNEDHLDTVNGRGGDSEFLIYSNEEILLQNMTFDLEGGRVQSSDGTRDGNAGVIDVMLFSVNSSIVIEDTFFKANAGNGAPISVIPPSREEFKAGDGGNVNFELYALNDVLINNLILNGKPGQGGEGDDDDNIAGDNGYGYFEVYSTKGSIRIIDSVIDQEIPEVSFSEDHDRDLEPRGGTSTLKLFSLFEIYLSNSTFRLDSKDNSYGQKTNTRLKLKSNNIFLVNGTFINARKGNDRNSYKTDTQKSYVIFDVGNYLEIDNSTTLINTGHYNKTYFIYDNISKNILKYPNTTLIDDVLIDASSILLISNDNIIQDNLTVNKINVSEIKNNTYDLLKILSLKTEFETKLSYEDIFAKVNAVDYYNYTWYVNENIVESGSTNDPIIKLESDKTKVGDNVSLHIENSFVSDNSSISIISLEDSDLTRKVLNLSIGNLKSNLNFYKNTDETYLYYENYESLIESMNLWMRKNCKKELCNVPLTFTTDEDLVLINLSLDNYTYDLLNITTYKVVLDNLNTSVGDEIAVKLYDVDGNEYISDRTVVVEDPFNSRLEDITASINETIFLDLAYYESYNFTQFNFSRPFELFIDSVYRWNLTGLSNGTYNVLLNSTNTNGTSITSRFDVIIN